MFDLRSFLIENKLTEASKQLSEIKVIPRGPDKGASVYIPELGKPELPLHEVKAKLISALGDRYIFSSTTIEVTDYSGSEMYPRNVPTRITGGQLVEDLLQQYEECVESRKEHEYGGTVMWFQYIEVSSRDAVVKARLKGKAVDAIVWLNDNTGNNAYSTLYIKRV